MMHAFHKARCQVTTSLSSEDLFHFLEADWIPTNEAHISDAILASVSLECLRAESVITRRCLYIANDSPALRIDTIEEDRDMVYEPQHTAFFDNDKFLKVFHSKWCHLGSALLNFPLILLFWFYWTGLRMITRDGTFRCLSMAFPTNVLWSIAGFLEKTKQLFSTMMGFLPIFLGKGMLILLDMIVTPIAKMTLQLWTMTSSQHCGPEQYRQISRVTPGWYDFIFRHEGVCMNCTMAVNTSLCSEFCGTETVSFLRVDHTLRYARDVRTTQGFTFFETVTFLLTVTPASYIICIQATKSTLMCIPVYGETIAQK
jgi:hypothetical protein